MMASTSPATGTSSTTTPTYELKLRAMKVDGGEVLPMREEQGVLLDSGSTHVLRPAYDEAEVNDARAGRATSATPSPLWEHLAVRGETRTACRQ